MKYKCGQPSCPYSVNLYYDSVRAAQNKRKCWTVYWKVSAHTCEELERMEEKSTCNNDTSDDSTDDEQLNGYSLNPSFQFFFLLLCLLRGMNKMSSNCSNSSSLTGIKENEHGQTKANERQGTTIVPWTSLLIELSAPTSQ